MLNKSGYIAVTGRPNAGKSTLLNRIAGGKISIVSHRRQTTRSVIRLLSVADGCRIVWLDTPGWQQHRKGRGGSRGSSGGVLNRALNSAAEWAASVCDAVVFVTVAGAWTRADEEFLQKIPPDKTVICALNKIDMMTDKNRLLPLIADLSEKFAARAAAAAAGASSGVTAGVVGGGAAVGQGSGAAAIAAAGASGGITAAGQGSGGAGGAVILPPDIVPIIPISAKRGGGVQVLLKECAARITGDTLSAPPDEDLAFFFAELVREKIFRALGDELPYKIGVTAEITEQAASVGRGGAGGALQVAANIYVERDSQKAIVLGKNGAMLKRIATAARCDMEKTSGKKVVLMHHVRVADWMRNPQLLRQMKIGVME